MSLYSLYRLIFLNLREFLPITLKEYINSCERLSMKKISKMPKAFLPPEVIVAVIGLLLTFLVHGALVANEEHQLKF